MGHGEGVPEGAKYISKGIEVREQWQCEGPVWLRLVDQEEQKERRPERRVWRYVLCLLLSFLESHCRCLSLPLWNPRQLELGP